MKKKEHWISALGLQSHPEGGYFKETYRSELEFDPKDIGLKIKGKRSLSTGIYFLIESENFSAFHRIKSDEMWHYYGGDPLIVHMIDERGVYAKQLIGNNLDKGEQLQFVVPANVWFASEVKKGGDYSLVGCTVSFGFDFADFELADIELIKKFPQHKRIIERLLKV